MSKKLESAAKQEWFVEQQAQTLAMRLLTNRSDLELSYEVRYSTISDYHVDILARIIQMGLLHEDGSIIERKLGIEVKGILHTYVEVQEQNFPIKVPIQDQALARGLVIRGSLYPLCLFLFNVRTNSGYYRWIIEPVAHNLSVKKQDSQEWGVEFSGSTDTIRLLYHPTGNLVELNQRVFDSIIDSAAAWYDALDYILEEHHGG